MSNQPKETGGTTKVGNSGVSALDLLLTGTGEVVSEGSFPNLSSGWLTERYRIEKKIGEGGMGIVLKCWDEWRKQFIALKLLHPWLQLSSQSQLRRELVLQESLHHDGVTKTFDMGCVEREGDGAPLWFFTMEFVEGLSLSELCHNAQAENRLPMVSMDWLVMWLESMADILSYAHQKGVIHRDLKPSNIIIMADGKVKLLDFGIAVALDGETSFSSDQAGTAYYMAPEQLEAGGKISASTDVYALGAIVYQLLTGRLVTGRIRGPWETLKKKGVNPPFRQTLDEVILKTLEPDAENRFCSVSAFWEAFQAAVDSPIQEASLSPTQKAIHSPTQENIEPDQDTDTSEKNHSAPIFVDKNREKRVSLSLKGRLIEELDSSLEVKTKKGSYTFDALLAEGDISDVFSGVCTEGASSGLVVVAKIVDGVGDNDLMRDEIRVLQLLHASQARQKKHLPALVDQFAMPDGRMGIILKAIEGYDLDEIHEAYPEGVPPEHMIWILRRVLSIIGYAHSQGILHANIEPAHIMVRPRDHNVYLVDWSYGIVNPAQTGQTFKCWNESFSAPEVQIQKPPVPASDLFSLGKTMVYLLGGDPETGSIPEHVDERLQRFLDYLTRESPLQRARDAWELYHRIGRLRKTIFGHHSFLEFKM